MSGRRGVGTSGGRDYSIEELDILLAAEQVATSTSTIATSTVATSTAAVATATSTVATLTAIAETAASTSVATSEGTRASTGAAASVTEDSVTGAAHNLIRLASPPVQDRREWEERRFARQETRQQQLHSTLLVPMPHSLVLPQQVITFLLHCRGDGCFWHTGATHSDNTKPHGVCRDRLCQFLGRPKRALCFKCGDDYYPPDGHKPCNALHERIQTVCRYCLCDHSSFNQRTGGKCPFDFRIRMLAVWAIRSGDGYRRSLASYRSPAQGLPHEDVRFPAHAPFGQDSRQLWLEAVKWITKTPVHNQAFWLAAISALLP